MGDVHHVRGDVWGGNRVQARRNCDGNGRGHVAVEGVSHLVVDRGGRAAKGWQRVEGHVSGGLVHRVGALIGNRHCGLRAVGGCTN